MQKIFRLQRTSFLAMVENLWQISFILLIWTLIISQAVLFLNLHWRKTKSNHFFLMQNQVLLKCLFTESLSLPPSLPSFLPACLPAWLPAYLPTYLSVRLSFYLSFYLLISLSIYRSIDRSIYRSIDLSIYLSIYLSTYLSTAFEIQVLRMSTTKCSNDFRIFQFASAISRQKKKNC